MKERHPEWVLHTTWTIGICNYKYRNLAVELFRIWSFWICLGYAGTLRRNGGDGWLPGLTKLSAVVGAAAAGDRNLVVPAESDDFSGGVRGRERNIHYYRISASQMHELKLSYLNVPGFVVWIAKNAKIWKNRNPWRVADIPVSVRALRM